MFIFGEGRGIRVFYITSSIDMHNNNVKMVKAVSVFRKIEHIRFQKMSNHQLSWKINVV